MNKWKKNKRGNIRNRINNVMKKFYGYNVPFSEAIKLLIPIYNDLKICYETEVDKMMDLHKKYDIADDPRTRTYSVDDKKHVMGTLYYISDRWCNPSRIQFLIDLIEKYHPEVKA